MLIFNHSPLLLSNSEEWSLTVCRCVVFGHSPCCRSLCRWHCRWRCQSRCRSLCRLRYRSWYRSLCLRWRSCSPKRNKVEAFLSFCVALFAMATSMSPSAFETLAQIFVQSCSCVWVVVQSHSNHRRIEQLNMADGRHV